MRVISLNNEDLRSHAQQLQQMCPFVPDAVVGIANGGALLSYLIFPESGHISIDCHRPSTRKKQNAIVRWLLRHLPYAALDQLRMVEARILSRRKREIEPTARISGTDSLAIANASKILLVDDAVDSGCTMRACYDLLASIAPKAEIATAAITITTKNPAIRPDYCIYDNLTLIRFPWSIDAKK